MKARSTFKTILTVAKTEGLGAKIHRSIGIRPMRNFTPFLLCDHFTVKPGGGFPDHPHSGFSTITYVLKGRIAHEDFTGSSGMLRQGDLQFMTAGKGIVHAEVAVKTEDDDNTCIGLQLWVDLPSELKNCDPLYRDLKREEIPVVKPNDKISVKLISGETYGVKLERDLAHVSVDYYHYRMAPGGQFIQPFSKNYNVFLYLIAGALEVNGSRIEEGSAVFFNRDGDNVTAKVPENQEGHSSVVVIGGQPLDQPVFQSSSGLFVGTSRDEIRNTSRNYKDGKNEFQRAREWRSKIGKCVRSDADIQ
jgi:redox-sensitive bicupin YhaK (pirin superfamily)